MTKSHLTKRKSVRKNKRKSVRQNKRKSVRKNIRKNVHKGGKLNKSLKNRRKKYISRRGRNNKKNRRLSVKQRGGYPKKTFVIEGKGFNTKLLIKADVGFGFEGHITLGDFYDTWELKEIYILTKDRNWVWSSAEDVLEETEFKKKLILLDKHNPNVKNSVAGNWDPTTLKYIVPIFRVPEISAIP